MPSKVDIANGTLRLIGASSITSFTDGTKNANVINDMYDDRLEELLRIHDWNFATKRVKLAQDATAPAFGWDHAYSTPSDWLRTVSLHDNSAGLGTIVWSEEQNDSGNAILTDADDVYMAYIAKVTDPNLLPADFRLAFQYSLAAALAIPIASSNALEDTMERRALRQLMKAKSSDAIGSTPVSRPRGTWADSRSGWRRS